MTLRTVLLGFLGSSYLRFVGLTSRILWVNRDTRDALEATGKGFIYAFWHGRQVFLAYLHRGDRIRPLVSQSRDGEIIARVCKSFGLDAIRGSSSRGGVSATLEIQRSLAEGARVGFTPDGPRGPLRKAQRGVLFAAQKAGVPIVPLAFGARRRWVFGSWDEFLLPKPFNRIAIAYGEPLHVSDTDDLEKRTLDLEVALDAVSLAADQSAGFGS